MSLIELGPDAAITTAAARKTTNSERARRQYKRTLLVLGLRLGVVAAVLGAWQYLPQIPWLQHRAPVFDPFFVSSPSKVFSELVTLATGANGQDPMWGALAQTLEGTFVGIAIGSVAGALLGLVFSQNRLLSDVLGPFVAVLNAMPRIALIPIFIIIAGATIATSILTSVSVVFFLVFYNAFNGGLSVPAPVVQNAQLLGASSLEVMLQIRLRYVLVWTLASLPNAISFGLVSVVTAEMLTGAIGMGRLLSISVSTVDSTLTFTVVTVLTIVGASLVLATDLIKRRALHWWTGVQRSA